MNTTAIFVVALVAVTGAVWIYTVMDDDSVDPQTEVTQTKPQTPTAEPWKTPVKEPTQEPVKEPVKEPIKTPVKEPEKPASTVDLPGSFALKVPFTPQAPTGNWDELHNEACEEASLIMAHAYFAGKTESKLSAEYVEGEIDALTKWEKENLGYYLDADAAEVARMAQEVYWLKAKVVSDYTEDSLKKALNDGKVIIYFAAGRKLGNPNFRTPGPLYHVVVIKGYNGSTFITNDPGTRNGMGYKYSYATLEAAGADWDHIINSVNTSKPVVVEISK